jgi:membrane protein EpsK
VPAKRSLPDTAKSRFVINVSSNAGYVILNTALMLWYVPFLMHHLGVAAYGMVPLANSLVMFATIISSSLDVSINRFLAIDLNQGDDASANRTFNTSLALCLIACAIMLLPASIVTYFLPALFNIPAGLELATQFLFAGVSVAMLAAMVSGSFGVASLITHRFDLFNIVRSLTSLSRLGVVVLCFAIWSPSLWYVAAGFVISAAVGLIGDVMVWRRLTPQLYIDRRDIDRRRLHSLAGLGGWSAVNQAGALFLTQVNLVVVNMMFGAEMTGRYGSLLLFPTLIETMTGTVVTVLSPAIMACYAVGDVGGMRNIASRSVKLLGVGLALPIGLLCGFSRPLLSLWLGPDFAQFDFLLVLLVAHLAVNLAIRPLLYVITAYNKVKIQGILTLALGVANLALAVSFARWSGWGAAGVAAATAIVWTIKNVVFLSSYTAGLMRLPWWTFFAPLTAGALGTLAVALVSASVTELWWPASWLALGAMASAVAAVYAIVSYAISLNGSDRALLWSLLYRRTHD